MATPKYKEVILESSLLFRWYEIREGPADHVLETCHAVGETLRGWRAKCCFEAYVQSLVVRLIYRFDDTYVIYWDGNKDKIFGDETERKGHYCYCLVMPAAAERNLGTVLIHHEDIARKNLEEFIVYVPVSNCEKGYIHGDISCYCTNICMYISFLIISIFMLHTIRIDGGRVCLGSLILMSVYAIEMTMSARSIARCAALLKC